MKKQPNGTALAVQEPSVLLFDAPYLDSLGDDEIEALRMQEPIPPNQGFQFPAEEFPSDDNNNENLTTLNYYEH